MDTLVKKRGRKAVDLTNKTLGYLRVIERAGSKNSFAAWRCICKCGKEKVIRSSCLIGGFTKSCGCIRKTTPDIITPTYKMWRRIKLKATKKGSKISITNSWLNFDNFQKDMGDQPSGYALDRRTDSLGYTKDNCVWVKLGEQKHELYKNKHNISYKGQSKPLNQWAKDMGLSRQALSQRISAGWTIEKCLTKVN